MLGTVQIQQIVTALCELTVFMRSVYMQPKAVLESKKVLVKSRLGMYKQYCSNGDR